jgi:hypothetical protein
MVSWQIAAMVVGVFLCERYLFAKSVDMTPPEHPMPPSVRTSKSSLNPNFPITARCKSVACVDTQRRTSTRAGLTPLRSKSSCRERPAMASASSSATSMPRAKLLNSSFMISARLWIGFGSHCFSYMHVFSRSDVMNSSSFLSTPNVRYETKSAWIRYSEGKSRI